MKVGKRPLVPDNKRRRRYIFIYIWRRRGWRDEEEEEEGWTDFELALRDFF